MEKGEVRVFLMSYAKISLKWIQDLSVRVKIIKLLEEKTYRKASFGSDFLTMTPKPEAVKEQINWTSSKLKSFVYQRKTVKKVTHRMGENVYQIPDNE